MVFSIWEFFELKAIRKKLEKPKPTITDSNYFDLNAKIKSILAVGSFIVIIIGFLGWNTIDGITEDVKNKLSAVDSLSSSVDSINTEIENILTFIEIFNDVEKGNLEKTISETKSSVTSISNKLLNLSDQIKKIPRNLELIKDLRINMKEFGPLTKKSKRFFYNEMTSYKGNKLPLFKENPTILIFNDKGLNTLITEATIEYFDLQVLSSWECSDCRFDLLIFY